MKAVGPVVVTGASGFVGRALVADLAARGMSVRALVRDPAAAPREAAPVTYDGLDDRAALASAMQGAGAVVHLAARVHVMRENAADADAAFTAVNVDGTRHLLNAAREAGVPRFVFASSVKAVGEWNEAPWTEDKTPAPQNAYGRSKLAVEALVREAQRDGMHAPILRLPLVYGPGVKANLLNLIAAIDRGWPLPFGGVRNRRSLVARENLLAAIHAVLQAPGAAAGTYFVSDDHDLSSADLCTMIAQGLGRRARLLPVPEPWLHAMGTTGDLLRRIGIPAPVGAAQVQRLVGSLTVSPARLRADTGWVPVVDPASALAATARWYRERHL